MIKRKVQKCLKNRVKKLLESDKIEFSSNALNKIYFVYFVTVVLQKLVFSLILQNIRTNFTTLHCLEFTKE